MATLDALSFEETMSDDMQKNPQVLKRGQLAEMPRCLTGELVVISTQPESATGMITFTLEDIETGDVVELEEGEGQ